LKFDENAKIEKNDPEEILDLNPSNYKSMRMGEKYTDHSTFFEMEF